MSDRYSPYPPDEPVIGATYPPPPPLPPHSAEPGYGGGGSGYADDGDGEWDDAGPSDGYDDQYDDGYGEPYYRDTPARQPMFYVFIGLAALVGGIVIFLLFSLVSSRGGESTSTPGSVKFNVAIQSPVKDKRIEIGKPEEVIVEASSTEPIVRFELFIEGNLADTVEVRDASADNKYRANLKASFERKGEYNLYVKVTSSSGATKQTDKLRVIAIEPVGDRPATINGKVVATVNLRTGPGENFEQVGTLTEGKIVKIIGRTTNNEWLLVDMDGGRWVKASAIDPQDSLALVPIRQVTPTPQPATNTPQPSPSASPSPTASPTQNATAPDFEPTNAVAIDGGTKLRVTVTNRSANNYSGAVVVAVSGVGPGTLTQAFNMALPAGGSAVADFELKPPVTTAKTVVVKVDPDNAVKETNKDNNSATFTIAPAPEQPDIAIQSPSVAPSAIGVTIINNGAALAATNITVRVKLGGAETSQTQTLALAKGQTAVFSVTRPQGNGIATIEVVIGGQVLASTTVPLTP